MYTPYIRMCESTVVHVVHRSSMYLFKNDLFS
jgi:hypothetical protein